MAKVRGLGKREKEVKAGLGLFLAFPVARGNAFGINRVSGNGIAIAKPLREIDVFATLGAERGKGGHTRLSADWAGFGGFGHSCTI